MNKAYILVLALLTFTFIYKFGNNRKTTILNNLQDSSEKSNYFSKVISTPKKNSNNRVQSNSSFQDLELKFKDLSAEKIFNLSRNAQNELSYLDHLNYDQFSEGQLQAYNETLKKRIVLKKIIFMEKYGK